MPEPRVIKRYANRKLYDTQHSRYVTLDQIAEMIRNGDDIKIIDNKTKEDLTSVTLAQIIFEEEKKQRSFLPLQAMRNIIQTGGESIHQLVASAQKRVTGILPGKRADGEPEEHEAGELEPEETYAGRRPAPSNWRELREWLESSQRTLEEWQRRVVVGISTPFAPLQTEVRNLRTRIAELEAKLRKLVQLEERGAEEVEGDDDPVEEDAS
jgi:polyhydroxyalkanoate synthesis repressor PhaR